MTRINSTLPTSYDVGGPPPAGEALFPRRDNLSTPNRWPPKSGVQQAQAPKPAAPNVPPSQSGNNAVSNFLRMPCVEVLMNLAVVPNVSQDLQNPATFNEVLGRSRKRLKEAAANREGGLDPVMQAAADVLEQYVELNGHSRRNRQALYPA